MSERRITKGGTFGPVFASGVCPDGSIHNTEGLVEILLLRYDAVLSIELTVEAAHKLTDQLLIATERAIPPTKDTP